MRLISKWNNLFTFRYFCLFGFHLKNMPICLQSNGLYCDIFHRMKWDSLFTFACWFLMFCPRRIMCPVHMMMFFLMDIVIKSVVMKWPFCVPHLPFSKWKRKCCRSATRSAHRRLPFWPAVPWQIFFRQRWLGDFSWGFNKQRDLMEIIRI